jgi:hypothetical protein
MFCIRITMDIYSSHMFTQRDSLKPRHCALLIGNWRLHSCTQTNKPFAKQNSTICADEIYDARMMEK